MMIDVLLLAAAVVVVAVVVIGIAEEEDGVDSVAVRAEVTDFAMMEDAVISGVVPI